MRSLEEIRAEKAALIREEQQVLAAQKSDDLKVIIGLLQKHDFDFDEIKRIMENPEYGKKVRKPREQKSGRKYQNPETGEYWINWGVGKKKQWVIDLERSGVLETHFVCLVDPSER